MVCPRCQHRFGEVPGNVICPHDGTPLVRAADLAAADGDPMLGRVLAGRFTILARLGAGSMGTVYRAKQSPIGREVAIKILRSDRAVDEVSRARFLREARANSVLTSANTVTVFDFGQSDQGEFYLAMELLEGESLGQRLKRMGRIPIPDAVETAKQALRSLSEAHAKGIIHRDLKPDNLFFSYVCSQERRDEVVKVLDFGIAKMLRTDGELEMNAVETQAGTVFGTPRYMSPEQAQGKPLDARSDLYSLGVILYHMLAGRPPYTDDDAIVVMARHIKTPPRLLSEVAPDARVPSELEALVMRVLSKEPDRRPDSADAFIADLVRATETAVITSGVRASLERGLDAVLDRSRSVPPPPPTVEASDALPATDTSPQSARPSVPPDVAPGDRYPSASVELSGRRTHPSRPPELPGGPVHPSGQPTPFAQTRVITSLGHTSDTLTLPPGVRRPRLWAAFVALLVLGGLGGTALVMSGRLPARSVARRNAIAAPEVATPSPLPPPLVATAPPAPPVATASSAPSAAPRASVPSAAPRTITSPAAQRERAQTPTTATPATTPSVPIPTVPATALPRSEPTRAERPQRVVGRPPASKPAGSSSVGYGYLE
jgi:serine/threonine-protein kinase